MFKKAEVKFNDGQGALLCNSCQVIIATGFDHEDTYHYCENCGKTERDILHKLTLRMGELLAESKADSEEYEQLSEEWQSLANNILTGELLDDSNDWRYYGE